MLGSPAGGRSEEEEEEEETIYRMFVKVASVKCPMKRPGEPSRMIIHVKTIYLACCFQHVANFLKLEMKVFQRVEQILLILLCFKEPSSVFLYRPHGLIVNTKKWILDGQYGRVPIFPSGQLWYCRKYMHFLPQTVIQ